MTERWTGRESSQCSCEGCFGAAIGCWHLGATGHARATVLGLEMLRESDRTLQRVRSVLIGHVRSMKNLSGTSLFATERWVMASLVDRPNAKFVCARWEPLAPNDNIQTASARGEYSMTGL